MDKRKPRPGCVHVTVQLPRELADLLAERRGDFMAIIEMVGRECEQLPPVAEVQAEADRQRAERWQQRQAEIRKLGRIGFRLYRKRVDTSGYIKIDGDFRERLARFSRAQWRRLVFTDIAEELDVHRELIELAITRFRSELFSKIKPRRDQAIFRLYSQGLPEREIARRVSVSITAIIRFRKANLVKIQKLPGSRNSLKKIKRGKLPESTPGKYQGDTLCDLYGVTVGYVLGQDNDQDENESVETVPDAPLETVEDLEPDYGSEAVLDELDALRALSFNGYQRRAMALVEELTRLLRFLEPEELHQLANDRGLFLDSGDSDSLLSDFLGEDIEEGQKYCGLVEERIADTAILGVDMHAVEIEALEELANDIGIEFDGEFLYNNWSSHEELVPAVRPQLRAMAFSGTLPQFEDIEKFPRRDVEESE